MGYCCFCVCKNRKDFLNVKIGDDWVYVEDFESIEIEDD